VAGPERPVADPIVFGRTTEIQKEIIGRSPGLQVLARAARLTSEISASFRTIASAGANAG
jgi:hypothetical protein